MKPISAVQGVLAASMVLCTATPAQAANPYLNPAGVKDGLELREGARGLMAGARAESVVATADGSGIQLAPGAVRGTLTLRSFATKFPFNEAIPTWNGRAGGGSGFRVTMRIPASPAGVQSPWFPAGYWGAGVDDTATTRVIQFPGGKYDEDHLVLERAVPSAELTVELARAAPADPSPVVRLVALSYTDSTGGAGGGLGGFMPAARASSVTLRTTESIPLPYRMQLAATKKLTNSICSPASVSAALGRFGTQVTPTDIANIAYDKPSDIYGMWNRSVQAGAQMGLRGYITRFRDWNAVRKVIRQGGVICPSIRFRGGEVDDPLRRHGRRMDGTKGHIVAIKGLAPRGTVIIQDPASKDWGPDSVWTQDDFAKAWFDKGGVGYVFTGPAGR